MLWLVGESDESGCSTGTDAIATPVENNLKRAGPEHAARQHVHSQVRVLVLYFTRAVAPHGRDGAQTVTTCVASTLRCHLGQKPTVHVNHDVGVDVCWVTACVG